VKRVLLKTFPLPVPPNAGLAARCYQEIKVTALGGLADVASIELDEAAPEVLGRDALARRFSSSRHRLRAQSRRVGVYADHSRRAPGPAGRRLPLRERRVRKRCRSWSRSCARRSLAPCQRRRALREARNGDHAHSGIPGPPIGPAPEHQHGVSGTRRPCRCERQVVDGDDVAGPRCCKRALVAAERLINAPSGARLPGPRERLRPRRPDHRSHESPWVRGLGPAPHSSFGHSRVGVTIEVGSKRLEESRDPPAASKSSRNQRPRARRHEHGRRSGDAVDVVRESS